MMDASAVRTGADAPAGQSDQPTVRSLTAGEEKRWDDFVAAAADGTFFHLSGWRSIIENRLRHPTHYLYAERRGTIVGVLPLAHVKSLLFGNALISLPFLVAGGVLASDDSASRQLVDAARDLATDLGVDYLELRNRQPLAGDWHTTGRYASFRKAIDPDPDKNLQAIPRKQRAMIRKGINAGLEAEQDQDTDRLYAAMLECKRNLGTPFFGAAYLRDLKETFGDAVEVVSVTRERQLVCSVMSFRYRNEILPYYGGGGDLARRYKGNDFMYWAVMEAACRNGVEIFDYGRSMVDSGAYRFKKHWGFEPELFAYQYFLVTAKEPPNLNPSNPRYRFLINTWKRLPLPVAALLGPPVARLLG